MSPVEQPAEMRQQVEEELERARGGLCASHEYGAHLIHAIETNTPRVINANVRNTGLITNLPWANPKAKITQALEASFKQTSPQNRFAVDCFNAGYTFEALLVAADAFSRAKTTDGPALMDAIRKTNITDHVMTGGPIAFDEKGDNPNITSVVIENLKRTPTVVYPNDMAAGAPVLPLPPWQGRA